MDETLAEVGALVQRARLALEADPAPGVTEALAETAKRLSVQSHRKALLQLSLGLIRLHTALGRYAELPVGERAQPSQQIARLVDALAQEHAALSRTDSIDGPIGEIDAPPGAALDLAGPRTEVPIVLALDRQRLLPMLPPETQVEGLRFRIDVHYFDELESLLPAWVERPDAEALLAPVELIDPLRSLAHSHRKLAQRAASLNLIAYAREGTMALRMKAVSARARGFFVLPAEAARLRRSVEGLLAERRLSYRALIVDDDRSTTLTVATVLRRHGIQADTIQDPARVLALIERAPPDVVIADMFMPGMTGLDLLAVLRAHPLTAATPVILLSGDDDIDRRFDTLMAGGDDYLTKPIRPRHLVSAVIGRARQARALRRELARE